MLIYAIGVTVWLAVPGMADLQAAKSFVVLSADESVTFKDRDSVNKAVILSRALPLQVAAFMSAARASRWSFGSLTY